MSRDQVAEWFTKYLHRVPEASDIYKVSKQLFELGAYSRSITCLEYYVHYCHSSQLSSAGSQSAGRHLLAYCLLHLNRKEEALQEFKKCVNEGYHEDWQWVVELLYETSHI